MTDAILSCTSRPAANRRGALGQRAVRSLLAAGAGWRCACAAAIGGWLWLAAAWASHGG